MSTFIFWAVVALLYVLAFIRPGLACGYVLATFALEQCAQAFVPVAGYNNSLCNFLIAGSVLVGLFGRFARSGMIRAPLRAPAVSLLALIAYCYATLLWSLFPSMTATVLNASVPYLVVFVGLAPLLIQSPRDLGDCFNSLLVSATLSLGSLVLFADWGVRGVLLPFVDWESNPLALSQVAGSLLIALGLSPTIHRLVTPVRWSVAAVVLAVVVFVFLRSASRGQIVASVATVTLFASVSRGARWMPLMLVAALTLLGSGFLEEEVDRNAARWETEHVESSIVEGRTDGAAKLLKFWSLSSLNHVIFGLGHATSRDPRLLGSYPHVVPAEVLAEEGIFGALLYLVVLIVSGTYVVRAYRGSSGDDRKLNSTVAALLLFEFLLTLKQGTLLGAASFLLLLVLTGSLRQVGSSDGGRVATST